jgi:hypothetical protein
MTDIQWFAFVILPVALVAAAGLATWAFVHFIDRH